MCACVYVQLINVLGIIALSAHPTVVLSSFSLPFQRLRSEARPTEPVPLGTAGNGDGHLRAWDGSRPEASDPETAPAYSVMRLASSVQAAVELAEKTR